MFDYMPQTVAPLRMGIGKDIRQLKPAGWILLLSYRFGNHHWCISICITAYSAITITKVTCQD
jgi:hypothetical protein